MGAELIWARIHRSIAQRANATDYTSRRQGFNGYQSYGPFTLNPEFHEVEEIPMAAMEGEFAKEFKRQFKDWLKENNRQE